MNTGPEREGRPVAAEGGPDEDRAPDTPTDLPRHRWLAALRGTLREAKNDGITDTAAALTYYAALSVFPALLVLVSLVGLLGQDVTDRIIDSLGEGIPGSARDILTNAVDSLQSSPQTASTAALLGLVGAIWTASGFVGAYIRASNIVYDVPEGRPFWKTIPLRLALTVVLLVVAAAIGLIVVFTGGVAEWAGDLIGLGSTAVTIWQIAKWPVLLLLLMLLVALLNWASPNARRPGFRWVTPGGVVGVLLWVVASGGFAFYVANFGNYNKVYGTLAGVIVFLVWLWVSNLALLVGAEFDAELDRARAHEAGLPQGKEPYLPLRDDPPNPAGS